MFLNFAEYSNQGLRKFKKAADNGGDIFFLENKTKISSCIMNIDQ